jgi:formylglycine-generating enzyme required for sulfatase activity
MRSILVLLGALVSPLVACSRPASAPPPAERGSERASHAASLPSARTQAPAPAEPPPAPAPAPAQEPEGAPPPARIEGMILVPAGPFVMGADRGGEPDERPAHTVTLPAFYLDENEVTNEAYARCVEAKICSPPEPKNADRNGVGPDKRFRGPRQPVSSVSWDGAQAYCAFVGKRLPTEAEREKAARGTDGRIYPWGNTPPGPERAVFQSSVTEDVGTHPKGDGPYGHHDLAGNVWEWVEDVYDPFAYQRPSAAQGVGGTCEEALAAYAELREKKRKGFTGSNSIPTECERVLRGGGFNYHATGLRATNRVHHPAPYRMVMSGFRCAKDVGR